MKTPDVSVVVPVYNAMPYLNRCLSSLAEQTIGMDRMELIAVDDGSTDGGGRRLDRFARRYPELARVVHQANSGGPAGPCNRALDLATGRYVFFLGADDYLGSEALERLVAAADRYESDVVLGRSVGVNNRYIHQAVYASTEPDLDIYESGLVWSLSNTKLFRRELIERHGLRYREEMPLYSDQPFTLEACVRARRISALADYDYYYAVRRLNAGNITFRRPHEDRLRAVQSLTSFVAGLIEPGKQRDAVLLRHFTWEVAKLVEDDFLRLSRDAQERVRAGVAELVQRYLTDDIRAHLDIEARLRLPVAGQGTLDDLISVIRQDAERGIPPTIVSGDRWYAGYPGVRGDRDSASDAPFDVTEAAADWIAKLDVTSVAWDRSETGARALTITAWSPRTDLATVSSASVRVAAGELAGVTLSVTPERTGTTVRARFLADEMLAASAPRGDRRIVRAQVTAFDRTGSAALRAPRLTSPARLVRRYRASLYLITVTKDHGGHLVFAIAPITPRRVIARLLFRRHRTGTRQPHGGK